MITLSPKGRLFVEAALKQTKTASLLAEAMTLGPDPWSHPLSSYAANIAINALSEMELNIRNRLGKPELNDDERADLVNDLGYAAAVRYDLQRDTGRI
jgi:hypothetical protein